MNDDHIPYLIITGTPMEGFEFIGPFPTRQAAAEYYNTDPHLADGNSWMAPLYAPAEDEAITGMMEG